MMRKPVLILAALLCCLCCCVKAEAGTYTNPGTGYRAVLEDEIDLLTDQEEAELMETMKQLTDHTNVAFWSVSRAWSQSASIQNAEQKHISLFGSRVNGIVFMIDMNVRYMFLDTEGWIQSVIPKSTAQIITNNVRSSMSAGRYFEATQRVYQQVLSKINGARIAEPMRYLSSASIGIMGGLLFALILTVSRRNKAVPVYAKTKATVKLISESRYESVTEMTALPNPIVRRVYSPPRDSSSSGSSCSGGSSCSSCSSGSSCGGGSSF